jgi:hypothetical protein
MPLLFWQFRIQLLTLAIEMISLWSLSSKKDAEKDDDDGHEKGSGFVICARKTPS